MTDIEIANSVKLKRIEDIAKAIDIDEEYIESYGKYKAKISLDVLNKYKNDCRHNGKLILVTAMNPTPLGEGKTTISISLADGLRKIGKKSMLALREPSLGPVFGVKGGATGGGMSQIAPMDDINLHFTGDIHAITSANNLLSAMIDNHIFSGNELGFDKVVWKRCLDVNDRQLRIIETGLSGESKMKSREDKFDITAASEIMAIVCLAKDLNDLKLRLGNIIVGYNINEEPIFAKQLHAEGSMTVLLKDCIKPNLVQTLEATPCIVHGGPFANIAHGCNSFIATNMALKLSDYVVTEAGFGADLGAEKFIDIKCRNNSLNPNCCVLVTTIKAIKYHGGVDKNHILEDNMIGIEKGIENVYRHIDNLQHKFNIPVVVALNHYDSDTRNEIELVKSLIESRGYKFSIVDAYTKGGYGAIDLSNKVVESINKYQSSLNVNFAYEDYDSIVTKINKVAKNVYGAKDVIFSEGVIKKIDSIENMGFKNLPICIAKTQYSFSDNPKNLGCDLQFDIHVTDIEIKSGAGFVVVYCGKIMTMPGLPKKPAAESIDIDSNGNIVGLF